MKRTILMLMLVRLATAQAPTGSIAGVIRDPSGAAVSGARVKAVSLATGVARSSATREPGDFSLAALPAGEYEVSVEAAGFQRMVRNVTVEAGSTTSSDFDLSVGDVKESVTVDGAMPQMHYDSHSVGGVVTHQQVENLPLNGRNFLELAKLEPGVGTPSPTINNRQLLSVLGTPQSVGNLGGARVTVDGGSITAVGYGGAQMGLSQEAVQEFQVSTINFDLSTGIAYAGSINVVSRSGSNQVHGTAFEFFRDHKLSAYPALIRDPATPDPFFQRRQFGFALGGPIRRDRIFVFGNWERNEQRGVVATTLLPPDFAHFSRINNSPFFGDLLSVRLDGRISNAHTAFVRYSHDGNRAFGPDPVIGGANSYPSAWTRTLAWADQSLLGLTSVLRPTVVNEFRFSYFFVSSGLALPTGQDCPGCIGIGSPAINIGSNAQAGFYLGRATENSSLVRRFQFTDSISWQSGKHRLRSGVEWEYNRGGYGILLNEPATLTLFTPDQVRASKLPIPLPAAFHTMDDILQLPLSSVTIGIGSPKVPQENGGMVRRWNTLYPFVHDDWRVRDGLNLNFGLAWSFQRDLNYDLTKPAFLAPILGAGNLGPTRQPLRDFSPTLGVAWSPWAGGKTVLRAGAGVYYALEIPLSNLDAERVALGPPGLGRQNLPGSVFFNPLPGIPGISAGTPLDFHGAPTQFTGADLISILPALRASQGQNLPAAGASVTSIQVTKQASAVFPQDYRTPSAQHANLGMQRQVTRDFVVSADLVYRHFLHTPNGGGLIDLNHYSSSRGPVITKCSSAQRNDPQTICSLGAISVYEAPYRYTYKGLLMRAEKRFSHGFQLLGSYAWSHNTGTQIKNGFNNDNWLQNVGPSPEDQTHVLNIGGVTRLPWRFELGLNFSYSSIPPLSAYVGGADFNGDGTANDLLPGTTVNAFNRSMGRSDLERLLAQFNQSYAGTKDAQGRAIQRLTLPANYSFGRNYQGMDLRLSRPFVIRERWRVSLIGEVFNTYNKANLSGYSGDLTSAAFGRPTSRATQVFGSGGPRAFQLALRVSF